MQEELLPGCDREVFERVWKRVTSETKRARFSGASSRPRLLLS